MPTDGITALLLSPLRAFSIADIEGLRIRAVVLTGTLS
jgi:hypothetical protein